MQRSRPSSRETMPRTFSDSASFSVTVLIDVLGDLDGQPGDPHHVLAPRVVAHLEIVGADRVVGLLVLAVEAGVASEVRARGVDGEVPPLLSVEQRDVLDLVHRPRVGERCRNAACGSRRGSRSRWGAATRSPRSGLPVREQNDFPTSCAEDLVGPPELARVHLGSIDHLAGLDSLVERGRVHAHEHGVDGRLQRVAAGDDAQLRPLGLRERARRPSRPGPGSRPRSGPRPSPRRTSSRRAR